MNKSRLVFAILLSGLFGLGLAAAFTLAGASPQSPSAPAIESDAARDLAPAVRSLVQQIDRLERALAAAVEVRRELPVAGVEGGGGAARPAPASAASSMAAGDERPARREAAASAPSPGARALALDGAALPKQSEALVPLMSQNEEDRSRAHWFLTYQQVLARYGRPDSMDVSPEGTLVWIYNEAHTRGQLGFTFFDGFVVRVWGGVPPRDEDRAN